MNKRSQKHTTANAKRIVEYLKNIPTRQCTMFLMEKDLKLSSGALSDAVRRLVEAGDMEKGRHGSYTMVKLLNDNPAGLSVLDEINNDNLENLEDESRWIIYAWWKSGKIKRKNLSEENRSKLLVIIDSCRESL